MRMVKTSVFDEVQAEYYIFGLLLLARVCVCVFYCQKEIFCR